MHRFGRLSITSGLVGRVAENDAGAAGGHQLCAQCVRGLPTLFRDPDEEWRARTPAAVQDQRQAVSEDGAVLAAQPLVGGEDAGFGPVAGKLDTPRAPGRTGGWDREAAGAPGPQTARPRATRPPFRV